MSEQNIRIKVKNADEKEPIALRVPTPVQRVKPIRLGPENKGSGGGNKPQARPAGSGKAGKTAPTKNPGALGTPSSATLFEGVYDAMVECDEQGKVILANSRTDRVFGFKPKEIEGIAIADLISGFTRTMLKTLQETLKPGRFTVISAGGRMKDESEYPAEITIYRPEGPTRLIFSFRKIDWRPQPVQTAVAITEGKNGSPANLYRELLRGLYDAVLVANLDGQIIDSNRRAMEFLLYSGSELGRMRIDRVIFGIDEGIIDRVRTHLEDGRFTVLDAYCVRKDGTRFPAEIAISRINLSGKGDLVFSIRNIERRKRTQDMLRTEHNALQNSASGIAITDLEAGIQYVNTSFLKLWGYESAQDVRGKRLADFFAEESQTGPMLEMAQGDTHWIGELEAQTAKGRTFSVQATAAPNRDSSDRMVGMVFSFIDITDRKKAEMAIRREADAQMRQAREQAEFSGNLNIISITDVLQLIDAARKSGVLHVTAEAGKRTVAELAFLDGQVVRAMCDNASGERAIYKLIQSGGEAFRFEQGRPEDRDESIRNTTMGLILEGSRQLDESMHGTPAAP